MDVKDYVPIFTKKIGNLNPDIVGYGKHGGSDFVNGNNGFGNGGDDGGFKDPGIR